MGQKRIKDYFDDASVDGRARLTDLRPTQIPVGLEEVEYKRRKMRRLAKKDPDALKAYLVARPIEVVRGPEGTLYVIDHHHLALALIMEGKKKALYHVERDLSHLKEDEFWRTMQDLNFVYLHDENGAPQPLDALPKKLEDMKDDPYRSLAGLVREQGGYDKVHIPFSEFTWADYFRVRIDKETVKGNIREAVTRGVELAAAPEAADLPGYNKKPLQVPKL